MRAVAVTAVLLAVAAAPAAASPRADRASTRTVLSELDRMLDAGAIDEATHDADRAAYQDALATWGRLRGVRRAELGAVIANLRGVAARGLLTVSRLRPLFLTLSRNRLWWTRGPRLVCGQRVGFSDSRLVWQYYPGQGIQLQMLANFGKANWYWSTGQDAELRELLSELRDVAAERAGGLAWEYYFRFGGARPPWASGLAQGTALQAFARGAQRLNDSTLLDTARRGLALFEHPPPVGVRIRTPRGAHYLIYSYAPGQRVLNGFLQSLVGLYDFSSISGDATGRALFDQGDAEARREVPHFDTGRWSLYQRGVLSDINYHRLVRDFLRSLCDRTGTGVYCATAQRFTRYLRHPPPDRRRAQLGCDRHPPQINLAVPAAPAAR